MISGVFIVCDSYRSLSSMANDQNTSLRPWFLDLVPLLVVLLIAAHVFALVLSSSPIFFLILFFCFFSCIARNSWSVSTLVTFRYTGFTDWRLRNSRRGERLTEELLDLMILNDEGWWTLIDLLRNYSPLLSYDTHYIVHRRWSYPWFYSNC